MRTLTSPLTFSVYLSASILTGCELHVSVNGVGVGQAPSSSPALQLAQAPSAEVYSGSVFSLQPIFRFLSNGVVNSGSTDSVTLSLNTDPACTLLVSGSLSIAQNPVLAISGLASFAGLGYTLPGHLEEKVYVRGQAGSLTSCSSGVSVLHRFNAGVGFATVLASHGDEVGGTALDASGRIVVVGSGYNSSTRSELILMRFYPDGTLDSSFGGDGKINLTDFAIGGASPATISEYGNSVQIDAQGKIVVVGFAAGGMAIWRFNTDGSLDTTFNSVGYVSANGSTVAGGTTSYYGQREIGKVLRIDSQGRYVIAGSSPNLAGGVEMAFWRYNPDGTLDATFGNAGSISSGPIGATGTTGQDMQEVVQHLALDSQNRIVAVGASTASSGFPRAVVYRRNADGTADSSFGVNGVYVLTPASPGNYEFASSLGIDSADGIAVGGLRFAIPVRHAVLFKLNSSGLLDASFASGGIIDHSSEDSEIGDIRIDSSGRVVAGGSIAKPGGGRTIVAWRYLANGVLDSNFANAGKYEGGSTGAAGATGANQLDGIARQTMQIDALGRIWMAGVSLDTVNALTTTVWRFTRNGALDL